MMLTARFLSRNMLVKKDTLGFGERLWCYGILADHHQVVQMFSEPGKADHHDEDSFSFRDAETMLNHLSK